MNRYKLAMINNEGDIYRTIHCEDMEEVYEYIDCIKPFDIARCTHIDLYVNGINTGY